jgi:hypothetical protein
MSYNLKADLARGEITPISIDAALLAAYRAGRANASMNEPEARIIANGLSAKERECYLAGYLGERERQRDCAKADRDARTADYPKAR